MNFVLDHSVAMRWLLPDPDAARQTYAMKVLACMKDASAVAPGLFWLEAANVLARAEAQGQLTVADTTVFVQRLQALPIQEHTRPGPSALQRSLALARQFGLSAYDACYLSVALEASAPLATLDRGLERAAREAGVAFFAA